MNTTEFVLNIYGSIRFIIFACSRRFCSRELHLHPIKGVVDVLRKKVLRGPLNVLIRKAGHEVVAVVVVGLQPQVDTLVIARFLGRGEEVLGQQLLLLVEVVCGTLAEKDGQRPAMRRLNEWWNSQRRSKAPEGPSTA